MARRVSEGDDPRALAQLPAEASDALRSRQASMLTLVKRQPLGAVAAIVVFLVIITTLGAPVLAPYNPVEPHYADRFMPPVPRYVMGTDQFGRDVFSRIIWGARTSVVIAFVAVFVGITSGAIWGLVSGYLGGTFDLISQRIVDAVLAFPVLILTLTVVAAFGLGTGSLIAAISLALVPQGARPVRSLALSLRQLQFVEAARALGARDARVILRHVLPNCITTYIVLATTFLGWAIVVEASLSFLGFGPPPPTPSWGQMLSGEGRQYLQQAPWLSIFPGLAISLVVFAFNLLGDAVMDTLDPRLRRFRG